MTDIRSTEHTSGVFTEQLSTFSNRDNVEPYAATADLGIVGAFRKLFDEGVGSPLGNTICIAVVVLLILWGISYITPTFIASM